MQRVVVLGPGGAGKSTFSCALSEATGIPWIELDKEFWSADLEPTPPVPWAQRQEELCAANRWILDGDLGPYDEPAPRLARADTVIVLDLALWRCAWRAARRSRQRLDFWRWLLTWRRRHRPRILAAVAHHAPHAELLVARHPREVEALIAPR